MVNKKKRTRAEQIAHLERSIKKFGDADGTRTAALDKLLGKDSSRK